ncbi:HEPN domain-containing protein [Candidatus Dependentiae bacterium]|jgi:HEPN domain-containing protein|nr:HEPN domain-containing protein [Candidatus Dependentiae bacterium]
MPGHRDWIIKARGDLRAAQKLVAGDEENDNEILGIVAYHAHQCAEKALKAFLVYQHQKIPKTHDLEGLLEECKKYDQHLMVLEKYIDYLSPYEMRTRYPDDQFSIDQSEALDAITAAGKVLNILMKLVRIPS